MTEDLRAPAAADADGRSVTTRRGADVLAVILMFVFATGAITLSLMPVVQNELTESVGLTKPQYGLLTTVFMAFYGVSGISSGIGAARWGGRLLVVCCGCFFLGSLIFGLSSSMAGFLVGRALQGLGGGMVIATCSPVLAHALPPKWLGRAWGILGAGWGIGEVVALLVMPSIQNAGGYRAVFLTTAGLGLRRGRGGPLSEGRPGAALPSRRGDHGPRAGHGAALGHHQPQGAPPEPHQRRGSGHRRGHPRVDPAVPPGHPRFARDHLAVPAGRPGGGADRRQSARRDRHGALGQVRGHRLVDDPHGGGDGPGGLRARGAARRSSWCCWPASSA